MGLDLGPKPDRIPHYTRNSKGTANSQPETIKDKAHTLSPQPSTLNLQPPALTLNLQPSAPHPSSFNNLILPSEASVISRLHMAANFLCLLAEDPSSSTVSSSWAPRFGANRT